MTDVLYQPSEWQQRFHDTARMGINEVLGAGSAGPGKTFCLLMDIVDQITIEHERCANKKHKHWHDWGTSTGWALHLRRTVKMLKQTIVLSHRMFRAIDPGATWNENETTWTFSSGFRYQFGHCKDPNDWEQYMSFEFCVAGGTPVLMADGSWKSIQDVRVGDLVSTLEGARRVTATHDSGTRPCVAVTVYDEDGAICGTQIQPTTHPVLLHSTAESSESSSASRPRNARKAPASSTYWQDYESLLGGLPESPVRRVSLIDAQNGTVTYRGSPVAIEQLPVLTVPVVLHARALQLAERGLPSPIVCRACGQSWKLKRRSPQERRLHHGSALDGQQPVVVTAPAAQSHESDSATCGSEDVRIGSGTATDLTGRCSACFRPRDEQPRPATGRVPNNVPRPVDAEERDPTSFLHGDKDDTPKRNSPRIAGYQHFYTGEQRAATEETHMGEADVEFAGFFPTFDLTVDGANHYITNTGLVNANTAIYFDELTAFDEEQYNQICTRLRSTDPVLALMLRIRAMSNPLMRREGDESYTVKNVHWVRDRFVKPCREGNVVFKRKLVRADGSVAYKSFLYLPAKLHHNPNKEFVAQYELQLLSMPAHIRAALLDGDWFITPGSFFAEYWRARMHVVRPFKIPTGWRMFRSMDWGFKAPGCIHWWALDDEGTLYCIKELRFQGKTVGEVAAMIETLEIGLGLWDEKTHSSRITGPADTQIWEQRGLGGKCMADIFSDKGVTWTKADKKSRQTNAQHIIKRLVDHEEETKVPGLVFFNTCTWIIEVLTGIQTSKDNTEEPADGGDDHPYDSCAYGCSYASRGKSGIPPVRPLKSEWDDEEEMPKDRARAGRLGYGQELC